MKKISTYDLGLASALLAEKYELAEIKSVHPTKKEFVFECDDFEDFSNRYFNGKLKVVAIKYFDSIKNLKNRIYSNPNY